MGRRVHAVVRSRVETEGRILFLAALHNFHIQAHLILSYNITINLYAAYKPILSIFEIKPPADLMPLPYDRPLPAFDLLYGFLRKPVEEVRILKASSPMVFMRQP
ncbi:MAG TPA: hypothetical protein VMM84_01625 [Pyrinomonadaceae bacterium]|nr:hypothetical protein [Pyrinomonadaceae bacterium]